MSFQSTIAKATLTGVAGAMALTAALAVPTFASAQSSGYYSNSNDGYYYDPCKRDSTTRATTGGVLGALAGAAIGSNLAGHHGGRTGGAALGGVVGAVAGANIGKSTAACQPGQYAPQQRQGYYSNGQTYYGSNNYQGGYQGDAYYDRSRNDNYAEDRYGNSYPVTERAPDAKGCTLAESPIYLPDGRVQKRFVRVCPDSSGRYQVVD